MRVVAVVQARTGSSRLPGKSLMSLAGRPMLEHVLERVLAVRDVHEVVLATSVAQRDRPLMEVAFRLGIRTCFGSEWDVLSRVRDAAQFTKADAVMRVTGDCPFFAPDVAQAVLAAFFSTRPDYVSNDTEMSGYPDGTDTEVFTREALERADSCAVRREDREHVTRWIRLSPCCSRGVVMCASGDHSALKLSVDRHDDFERAQRIHRFLPRGAFMLEDTLAACRLAAEEGR